MALSALSLGSHLRESGAKLCTCTSAHVVHKIHCGRAHRKSRGRIGGNQKGDCVETRGVKAWDEKCERGDERTGERGGESRALALCNRDWYEDSSLSAARWSLFPRLPRSLSPRACTHFSCWLLLTHQTSVRSKIHVFSNMVLPLGQMTRCILSRLTLNIFCNRAR